MTVRAKARNGHPRMIETDASSSISRIMKSSVKMNLLILTNRKRERGMRLMLTPMSPKAFLNGIVPIIHGNVKLLVYPFFWGKFFWIAAEHSSLRVTEEAVLSNFTLLKLIRTSPAHHPSSVSLVEMEKTPMSPKAFFTRIVPIRHGNVKLPVSPFFRVLVFGFFPMLQGFERIGYASHFVVGLSSPSILRRVFSHAGISSFR
ncbi:hypothetical protein Tco_1413763 [Tanacetum coccineum]